MSEEKNLERLAIRRRSVAPSRKERFEVLMEEVRSEFKAVAEGQTALSGRMDDLERKQAAQISGIKDFVMAMGRDLNGRIDGVEEKIDGVEKRLDAKIDGVESSLGAKIDAVARDLAEHRADTERHSGQYRVSER
mgnify:CR=1 FL=1